MLCARQTHCVQGMSTRNTVISGLGYVHFSDGKTEMGLSPGAEPSIFSYKKSQLKRTGHLRTSGSRGINIIISDTEAAFSAVDTGDDAWES